MTTKNQSNGSSDGWKPDDIDMEILACYRRDAKIRIAQVAKQVRRSENAVRKRVERLEACRILSIGASINYDRVSSSSIEAYIEVMFPGNANVHELLCDLVEGINRDEIREAITLIGDVDALIRVRAKNVAALRELVTEIRSNEHVGGTRTRIVAGNWWHGEQADGCEDPTDPVDAEAPVSSGA